MREMPVFAFNLSVWLGLLAGPARAEEARTRPVTLLPPGQVLAEVRAYLLAHAPRFIPPSDTDAWVIEAERLRARVLDEVVLRGVPDDWIDGSPQVVWGEALPRAGYRIRKLRYEAVPGLWVGALLYEPEQLAGKVPAILNPNGHVNEPGMTIDYKQVRCINLAKRGMLALNLEWIGMGQLYRPGYAHDDLAYLDLCGRAGVSVFYLALKRGLDVLLSHESADPQRVAVTGLSGGGWQTIFIGALDTRVKLAAPNAGYSGIHRRIWEQRDIGDLEQNPTDLVSVADYVHLTAMLYPRPALLIYNASDDCCFTAERALLSVFEPVAPLYGLAGLADRFAFHVNDDPGTHNYLKDNREAFYRFLNRHFVAEDERVDEEIAVDGEVRPAEALRIEYPPDNGSFYTLAAEAMKPLPTRRVPDGTEIESWRRETRALLRRITREEPAAHDGAETKEIPVQPAEVSGVQGRAYRLRVLRRGTAFQAVNHGQDDRDRGWTLPVVEYVREGQEASGVHLILADAGRSAARDPVARALAEGECAVTADLLFTGECLGAKNDAWQFAQMISTLGRRPLGIQVAQLDALVDHLDQRFPDAPRRLVARGRASGLAALVWAALNPGRVDRIRIDGLESSLGHLLAEHVSYRETPSAFCFGLLELVDVPELTALAAPTTIDLRSAEAPTPGP